MRTSRSMWWAGALSVLALAGGVDAAIAQSEESYGSSHQVELSVLGGVQWLTKNDTGVSEQFLNIPLVGALTYRFTPNWAAEAEFTWIIPTPQSVSVSSGPAQDMKTPDVLAYQAGVRASIPQTTWTPYLAAGAGAVTFLSTTDADRVPQLSEAQTMFAINFGAGASYGLASNVGLRADFRELVAFPTSDTPGFSSGGSADPIWMPRVAVGLDYRF